MKIKKVRTLEGCKCDPRVSEIEIEDYNIDKYMIFLRKGYRCIDEIRHSDSFETVADMCEFLNERVVECDCEDCKEG